ncbi:AtaL-like protein [Kitasatospora sp. NPDC002040]|uniref:AtaL-like protein n=1 Tax=Kitasatospora sp. NPDC002040 TaxID=3154661 RepID=UPI00332EFFCA
MSAVTISWTIAVNSGGVPEHERLDARGLWRELLNKAENPIPYVPAITECTVLDRFSGGFTRSIVRDGRTVFQRVEVVPGESVVYRQPGDPEIESISNRVDVTEDGSPALTISVQLAPAGIERAIRESRFLEAADAYFTDALRAGIDEIRAARPVLDGPSAGLTHAA